MSIKVGHGILIHRCHCLPSAYNPGFSLVLVSVYLGEDIPHSRLLTQDTDGREIVDIVGPQSRLRGLLNTAGSSLKEDPYTDDVLPHKLPVLKAIFARSGFHEAQGDHSSQRN